MCLKKKRNVLLLHLVWEGQSDHFLLYFSLSNEQMCSLRGVSLLQEYPDTDEDNLNLKWQEGSQEKKTKKGKEMKASSTWKENEFSGVRNH